MSTRAITDQGVHAPPSSGDYAYDSFMPSSMAFPLRGQSYADPVFHTAITRLTDEYGHSSWSDIYSKNGYWNADATLMVHNTPTGRRILRVPSGDVLLPSVPGNDNSCFDPVNPDVWWWYDFGDSLLHQLTLSTGNDRVVKDFEEPIGNNGGSIDWIDRTGRYFLLHLGNAWQLWDQQLDVLYDNPISDEYGSDPGYTGITPDAGYVITTHNGNPNAHRSWRVDHQHQALAEDGVVFWTLCGDHGDFISASDGKSYMLVMECDSICAVYAVDVSLAQSHNDKAKQLSDNRQLFTLSWSDSIHASRVSRGPRADWVFVCVESGDDQFDSAPEWRAFMQEILLVNVLTGELQRLAHHRSRSPFTNYYYQPRISSSWDGSRAAWASNMNTQQPDGYADVYVLTLDGELPPDPPDPEPEPGPEPEPIGELKLWSVRSERGEEMVAADSMTSAVRTWREATGMPSDPTSVTFVADEVIQQTGGAVQIPKGAARVTWDPLESTCRHASLSIL